MFVFSRELFIDDNRWITVERTKNGPIEEFLVSYQSLLPSTNYYFRVIAYNKYGISYPVTSNNEVRIYIRLVLIVFYNVPAVLSTM